MRKALLSAQGTQTALVVKDRIFLCITAEDDLGIPLKGVPICIPPKMQSLLAYIEPSM